MAKVVLTLIRVLLGAFWISQFSWKMPPTFGCPDQGFCLWVNKEIQYPFVSLYAFFIEQVVRPQVLLFGWFTFLVETSLGLSLLLGFLTRLGGFMGTLWSVNLLIGLISVPGESVWYYIFLLLLNLLYFAIGSFNQVALDSYLKLPKLFNFKYEAPCPTTRKDLQ